MTGVPEFGEVVKAFPPWRISPSGFANDARATCPRSFLSPFEYAPVTSPFAPMLKPVSEPGARPSDEPSTEVGAATWVRFAKETLTDCGDVAPLPKVRLIVPSGAAPFVSTNAPVAGSKLTEPPPETVTPASVVLTDHDQVLVALFVLVKVTVTWCAWPSVSYRFTVTWADLSLEFVAPAS